MALSPYELIDFSDSRGYSVYFFAAE